MSGTFYGRLTRADILSEGQSIDISEKTIPGCVCLATTNLGDVSLPGRVEGKTSTKEDASAMIEETVLFLASSTKLITAVAVLQCVECGQIGLDDPIAPYCNEMAEPMVMDCWKETEYGKEEPILRKATGQITVRQLLTHASGMSAAIFDP